MKKFILKLFILFVAGCIHVEMVLAAGNGNIAVYDVYPGSEAILVTVGNKGQGDYIANLNNIKKRREIPRLCRGTRKV